MTLPLKVPKHLSRYYSRVVVFLTLDPLPNSSHDFVQIQQILGRPRSSVIRPTRVVDLGDGGRRPQQRLARLCRDPADVQRSFDSAIWVNEIKQIFFILHHVFQRSFKLRHFLIDFDHF